MDLAGVIHYWSTSAVITPLKLMSSSNQGLRLGITHISADLPFVIAPEHGGRYAALNRGINTPRKSMRNKSNVNVQQHLLMQRHLASKKKLNIKRKHVILDTLFGYIDRARIFNY